MDNPYHLLIETLKPMLCRGMHETNRVDTQAFNYHRGGLGKYGTRPEGYRRAFRLALCNGQSHRQKGYAAQ